MSSSSRSSFSETFSFSKKLSTWEVERVLYFQNILRPDIRLQNDVEVILRALKPVSFRTDNQWEVTDQKKNRKKFHKIFFPKNSLLELNCSFIVEALKDIKRNLLLFKLFSIYFIKTIYVWLPQSIHFCLIFFKLKKFPQLYGPTSKARGVPE